MKPLYWILLLFGIVCSSNSAENPKLIQYGALIDDALDGEETMAYEFAVQSVNRHQVMLTTKLQMRTKAIYDIYSTSKKVCHVVREASQQEPDVHGVAALFGPYDPASSRFVQSFSSTFKIPHIQIHLDFDPIPPAGLNRMNAMSLNFYPVVDKLADALKEMAQVMKWKKIIIITKQSEDGRSGVALMKRVMEPDDTSPRDVRKEVLVYAADDFQDTLENIKLLPDFKNVIVDIPLELIPDFMQTADRMGLLSGYYHYHFTTLDLPTIQDQIGHLTEGSVNITAFSLVTQEFNSEMEDMKTDWADLRGRGQTKTDGFNIMLKTRNALIYDSVRYVSEVLDRQLKADPEFRTEKINCFNQLYWRFGQKFYDSLKDSSKLGVTGRIKFDGEGRRSDFSLDLIEFDVDGKVSPVGKWTTEDGMKITKPFDKVRADVSKDISRRQFKIAIRPEPPFVDRTEVDENGLPIPEDRSDERYFGFCIDMMKEIAKLVNMTDYTFTQVKDVGKRLDNNSYDGIVGGLIAREFDMGISPITISSERMKVVAFSDPYLSLGISVIMKKPAENALDIFSFMKPFDGMLWASIGASMLGSSVMLFIIGRFSPRQWDNPHPCNPDVDIVENDLSLANCIWFSLGSFLQQGTEIAPRSNATRIVACFWWLFCLICVSSYTANLAAFLTNSKLQGEIKSVDDLAAQDKVKYGCYKGGTTREFFKKSNINTYMKINSFMKENSNWSFDDTEAALKLVKKGGYAYFMESLSLRYELTKDCDLIEIGEELSQGYYSIALPLDSPYLGQISEAILKLRESQVILRLKNKHWNVNNDICGSEKKLSESSKLGLGNFVGVYIIMIALLMMAFIICITELIISAAVYSREHKVSFRKALLFDLRHGVRCCGEDVKPEIWHKKSEPEIENIDDNSLRSLGKLSLSIGSLNTTALSSRANTTATSRAPPTLPSLAPDSDDENTAMMNVTRETTGSQRSLLAVFNNRYPPSSMSNSRSLSNRSQTLSNR